MCLVCVGNGRYLSECRSGWFRHRLSGYQLLRLRRGSGQSDSQIFCSGHHTVDGADRACSIVCRALNTQSIIANLHQVGRGVCEQKQGGRGVGRIFQFVFVHVQFFCVGGSRKLLEMVFLQGVLYRFRYKMRRFCCKVCPNL